MTGGTLMISRNETNHEYYKRRFEELGFNRVTVTALERDALYSLIREMKPDLIVMGARFYHGCTPFLMGELRKEFPKTKMAAVCLGEYPPDIAMYFILNGINSYIASSEGVADFYRGLDVIAKGRDYVSPAVLERINLRRVYPEPAGRITRRHKEVIRLVCCGFKDHEIADTLEISRNTVVNHKSDIFTALNVRSSVELFRAALLMEMFRLEELFFYPQGMEVRPKPEKKKKQSSAA